MLYILTNKMVPFLIVLIATQLQSGCSRKYVIDSNFIEPYSVSNEVDQFAIGKKEYLFVNAKMSFMQAIILCNELYHADLAFIEDFHLAGYLAEALSETNLLLDSLWVAAVQRRDSDRWFWIRGDNHILVDQKIVDNFTYNTQIEANDRRCLSFSRSDHDQPQFRPLVCRARRALMCERRRGAPGSLNSTHPGWIKLGRRYYKIFEELVTWEMATAKCIEHDSDSLLAVVISFEDAQQLGRYLLIGRPSLENAWIGANWLHESYTFVEEDIILTNHSDSSNYPPWRDNNIKKSKGCILLDRHLSNITLFVEAHCERERPYICYKFKENDTSTDVIIDGDGYRLELFQRNWTKAREYCKDVYKNYSSNLVEIRTLKQKYDLLYVMGENRTAVNHIWLGGNFQNNSKWIWDTDNSEINVQEPLLNLVQNKSYQHNIEEDNVCLVMDRENHVAPLHYGTMCRYEHNFVCYFTAANLNRLIEDEKKKREEDENNLQE